MSTTSLNVALVRAPNGYRYNCLTIAEEPILTYLTSYLSAQGVAQVPIYDFHLQRSLTAPAVLAGDHDIYVIAFREAGENPHYVDRLANYLAVAGKRVIIYGQTARLRHIPTTSPLIEILPHDECAIGRLLGVEATPFNYSTDARAEPYMQDLGLEAWQQRRALATIETSRGCTFGCKFCFINQGKNYSERWTLRSNHSIVSDIQTYRDMGVHNVYMYDSEFLGSNEHDHEARRDLLRKLIAQQPGIHIKLFARADSLLAFNDFALLRRAGVVQVFVGVESFDDEDLRALNKSATGAQMRQAVEELKNHGIFSHMNFITFNRNTTLRGLQTNIRVLEEMSVESARMLGTPAFTFAFESNWRPAHTGSQSQLSDRTYVKLDLAQKAQPGGAVPVFNANYEPLMEMYRLLSYEWNKKLVTLSLARDEAEGVELVQIESWFANLFRFCLAQQRRALEEFSQGRLDLDSLPKDSLRLFKDIESFHREHLPQRFNQLETYADHAVALGYSSPTGLLEVDEYWADAIPMSHAPESRANLTIHDSRSDAATS